MVRVRYIGIMAPNETFARLRPWRLELIELRGRCFPLKADWLALDHLVKSLDQAAAQFTGDDNFYRGRAPNHRTP